MAISRLMAFSNASALATERGSTLSSSCSLVATHAERKSLFLQAGRLVVEITKRYYEQDDESV
ncbi:hypothetical protein QQ73_09145, partial [Candidatus Endoriftia persephone str. Guaymas]|nr:hypothetical protein [Candidatus Endoriftia persephone str. Guaymas]